MIQTKIHIFVCIIIFLIIMLTGTHTEKSEKMDIFYDFSKYIDDIDYSSYTLQYPPPFILESQFEKNNFSLSFKELEEDIGLYIHIPFCETKCTFCRYYSFVNTNQELYDQYIVGLIKELTLYKQGLSQGQKISSVYIGGGTPSILSEKNLEDLLSYIFGTFSFSQGYQFCIECNPSSVTYKKLEILKKYNCHRLTVGVQSMDATVLKKINRHQTKKDVYKTIIWAKEVGIPYVNIDLMLAIKGQSLHSFIRDVLEICRLKPDMVHLHGFAPTKNTIDNSISKEEKEIQMRMKDLGYKILQKYGHESIEGDASGLDKNAINKQLKDAITLGKYIGIGVSAVGFNGGYRYINTKNINEYLDAVNQDTFPIKHASKLETIDNMRQYIIYNIWYDTIDRNDFKKKFGEDPVEYFQTEFDFLLKEKVCKIQPDMIYFSFSDALTYQTYSKIFYDEKYIDAYIEKMKHVTLTSE